MTTEILNPTDENLCRAGELIRAGEIVAFPTETVYGLGADGLNVDACRKIYVAKGRPPNKPLTLHVANMSQVERVAKMSTTAERLFRAFCPGPITIILPKSDIVPDFVTGGRTGIGIRFPDNEVAQKLINIAGCPIAAPSANISGQPAPISAQDVYDNLGGRIPIILDGGKCRLGVSSTVVDISTGIAKILRVGTISVEAIDNILN